MENGFQDEIRVLRVPGNAIRVDEYTSNLPGTS